jgi:hypothetical protein
LPLVFSSYSICRLCDVITLIFYAITGTTTISLAASISDYASSWADGFSQILGEKCASERNVPTGSISFPRNGNGTPLLDSWVTPKSVKKTVLSNKPSVNIRRFIKKGTTITNSSQFPMKCEQCTLKHPQALCSRIFTTPFLPERPRLARKIKMFLKQSNLTSSA